MTRKSLSLLENRTSPWIPIGCLVLIGCSVCLAMIIASTVAARSILQLGKSDTQTWLDQAKRDLDDQQPQRVLDTLKPNLSQFAEIDERAKAFNYLGQAETQLGHFQFAAMYFENMYALEPTPEHLYMIAAAYDTGGDLRHALQNYRTLAAWDTPEADIYQSLVEQRITQLEEILEPEQHPNP